jgi:hypothetical protein
MVSDFLFCVKRNGDFLGGPVVFFWILKRNSDRPGRKGKIRNEKCEG